MIEMFTCVPATSTPELSASEGPASLDDCDFLALHKQSFQERGPKTDPK